MVFRRRPPRSTVVFLVVAVACASVAFSLMRGYAARLEALAPAAGPLVPVVVAAGEVERAEVLADDDVEVVRVPSATAPATAFREPADAIGRTTLTALAPGEAVTPTRLLGATGGPLASLVPTGLRAVPISVSSLPQGLEVGDRIDVLATYGEGRMYTETVGRELELLVVPGDDDASPVGSGGGAELVVLADPTTMSRLARSSVASVLSIAVVGVDGG
jgi:Flp pilus assembly protein CpaB